MKNIFIGLLFLCFNFNLSFNASTIDIIPDFVGYFLIYSGLNELIAYNQYFMNAKKVCPALAAYSLTMWILNIFGVRFETGILQGFFTSLGLLAMFVGIFMTFSITKGIVELEASESWELNGIELMKRWKIKTIVAIFTYLAVWIPLLNVVLLVVGIVFEILYLVSFNKSKNLFYSNNHSSVY